MTHFKPHSYPFIVSRVSCDAEIGSYKRGWHVCNAKAAFHCTGAAGVPLDYCKKHESRAKARKDVSVY